jgi:hypothetical protein
MGRAKKYLTEEDKINANREKALRYYHKNKNGINKEKLAKYYEKQIRELQEKLSELRN